MEIAVKISNLSVTLDGKTKALRNVTIDLPQGKTVGIIGPSGAGKTTLIRAIVGRVHLTKGNVSIFGLPAGSSELRERVTYMTQELAVYPDLTVRENLSYFVRMTDQPKKKEQQIIADILNDVHMNGKSNSMVSNLSGGQKQRVSLAIALIGSPKLMVLDEPTVGLDPVLRDSLWKLFARLAGQGTSLIITSHSMDEAERCDDLVLLRNGAVIAHSTPQELLEQTSTKTIEQSFLKLVGNSKE